MADATRYEVQARHLVEGLATAPTKRDRQNVLKLALVAFDHYDSKAHDKLSKGVSVLVHCLERAVQEEEWNEVASLCRLIAMLFRSSEKVAAVAFQQVGATLVVLVLTVLNEQEIPELACVIQELVSKLSQLTVSISNQGEHHRMLRHLHQVARQGNESFKAPVKRAALCLLAGLAEHDDNKILLMSIPSLVDDLLAMSPPDGGVIHLARFIRRLAWERHNKSDLLKRKNLITSLLKWQKVDDSNETSLNLMIAFRHLSSAQCDKMVFVRKSSLLKALVQGMEHPEFETDALWTLLHLITGDTASRLMKYPRLFNAILSATRADRPSETVAAHCIKKFSTFIGVCQKSHPYLIGAIVQLTLSEDATVRLWAARAFVEQSLDSKGFYLARSTDAMAALVRLASDSILSVQETALEALGNLCGGSANSMTLLKRKDLLPGLVAASLQVPEDQGKQMDRRRRLAVQGILALADCPSARTRVAKELDLVYCLSRFGVSQDEDDALKRAALHGVMLLAPLL